MTDSIALTEHPSVLAAHPVTEPLLVPQQQELICRLWDFDCPSINRARNLEAYLSYYEGQSAEARHVGGSGGVSSLFRSHGDVVYCLGVIKRNPTVPRSALVIALQSLSSDENASTGSCPDRVDEKVELPPETPSILKSTRLSEGVFQAAIAIAVKVLFAVHVNLGPAAGGIAVGNWETSWEDAQSLEALLTEALPTNDYSDETNNRITPSRIRARYLENNADIRVEWTHHLPDHLKLDIGSHQKVLSIFELASLLEVMYEASSGRPYDQSTVDSIKNGCYSPAFLYETLETIRLMFPAQDRHWLERKLMPQVRWFPHPWGNKTSQKKRDARLSTPFKNLHRQRTFDRPLTSRRELFARFPHWAVRLNILFEEAENPTPVSWIGRWSEKRKAARHTFWLALIAFTVAVFFGIIASALAAVQIWIAYCQWQGDGGTSWVCKPS